jgi:hypothetical protein
LNRLALLYIIASVRKGDWLVPVFHSVLDSGIVVIDSKGRKRTAHDDPQNFDLISWCNELRAVIAQINALNVGTKNNNRYSLSHRNHMPAYNRQRLQLFIRFDSFTKPKSLR